MQRARLAAVAATMLIAGVLLSACPTPNGYKAVRVLPKLDAGEMTAAVAEPGAGNNVLALSKPGVILRASLDDANASPATFMDISDRIIPNPGQEEGLLGIALAPDYSSSGTFYLYYSAGGPRRAVLSRFHAANGHGDAGSEQVLLEIGEPFANHNGGALAFGPDGDLYVGVGDGGSQGDPQGNGQNTNALLGKILRLDVSGGGAYRIPADNPFANGGGRPEVFAFGFRNPWRFAFDGKTGQLWVADVGQNAWEEVDRVERGQDYGWNIMEGNHCYKPSSGCNTGGLALPRAEYSHDSGCSVTGGYVYRGRSLQEMDGWFVYGDFCSGRIWAVNTADGASKPIQLLDSSLGISSFLQDNSGELYAVDFSGGIYRIMRK